MTFYKYNGAGNDFLVADNRDGSIHLTAKYISEICDRYISHPLEAVSVGDVVDVQVMTVDLKKQRIQLTMKVGTFDGGVRKETPKVEKTSQPKAKPDARKEKKNFRNNDGKKQDNPRKDNRRPEKKGNHFFDGIVIK